MLLQLATRTRRIFSSSSPAVHSRCKFETCHSSALDHAHASPLAILNYGRFIQDRVVSECQADIETCFGTNDDEKFQVDDLAQKWRLWLFQVCTQWGYFMPAPLDGPRIVSKFLTLEHSSKICRQAFLPGKHFAVPPVPDVEAVNALGDYAISADRLAFIDGDRDPWRVMTPGSNLAPKRNSTLKQPSWIIPSESAAKQANQ